MNKFVIAFLFVCCTHCCSAQGVSNYSAAIEELDSLKVLGWKYYSNGWYDSASVFLNQSIELNLETRLRYQKREQITTLDSLLSYIYFLSGANALSLGNIPAAEWFVDRSKKVIKSYEFPKIAYRAFILQGEIAYIKEDYKLSRQLNDSAISIGSKLLFTHIPSKKKKIENNADYHVALAFSWANTAQSLLWDSTSYNSATSLDSARIRLDSAVHHLTLAENSVQLLKPTNPTLAEILTTNIQRELVFFEIMKFRTALRNGRLKNSLPDSIESYNGKEVRNSKRTHQDIDWSRENLLLYEIIGDYWCAQDTTDYAVVEKIVLAYESALALFKNKEDEIALTNNPEVQRLYRKYRASFIRKNKMEARLNIESKNFENAAQAIGLVLLSTTSLAFFLTVFLNRKLKRKRQQLELKNKELPHVMKNLLNTIKHRIRKTIRTYPDHAEMFEGLMSSVKIVKYYLTTLYKPLKYGEEQMLLAEQIEDFLKVVREDFSVLGDFLIVTNTIDRCTTINRMKYYEFQLILIELIMNSKKHGVKNEAIEMQFQSVNNYFSTSVTNSIEHEGLILKPGIGLDIVKSKTEEILNGDFKIDLDKQNRKVALTISFITN